MVHSIRYSANYLELQEYVSYAFPDVARQMNESDSISNFILKWEAHYLQQFSLLMENASEDYWSQDEKMYSITRKAMCATYNAIAVELDGDKP